MTRVIERGQIVPPEEKVPFAKPADRELVFRRRADRLQTLASDHELEAFLMFMGALASAQQAGLERLTDSDLPLPECYPGPRTAGTALVDAAASALLPAWRNVLTWVLDALEPAAPKAGREVIQGLREAAPEALDELAQVILSGRLELADPARTPLVAAALQVYWTHFATSLPEGMVSGLEHEVQRHPGRCPVCNSSPVSSIVRSSGAQQGLRYLQCSLCSTEWQMTRIQCANCASTSGIEYLGLEGDKGATKVECCKNCNTYLKIFYQDKDPDVDPVADDLASLALELLVAEEGYQRAGASLLLVPGEDPSGAS